MLTITKKDKRLLMILAIVVILALPYLLVVKPLSEKNDIVVNEVRELKSQLTYLQGLEQQKDYYIEQTNDVNAKKDALLSLYPADITQEASIKFIYETENNVPVIMNSLGFTDVTRTPIGSVTTSDNQVLSAEALSTTTQITYESTYENFKRLLSYLEGFKDRVVITDISAVYNSDLDLVTGNFTLNQYAIAGSGKTFPETVIDGISIGTANIFVAYSQVIVAETEAVPTETDDYFIMLCQPDADVLAKTVGKSEDVSMESYVESDSNNKETIKVTFSKDGEEYFVSYMIGKQKKEAVSFDPGESLDLSIISSPRVGDSDKVSADIVFENSTDMEFHVTIKNDDTESPRVSILDSTGEVIIEE